MPEDEDLRFAVLGPVRAWRGDQELALGTPQQRALLALLLLHEGRPVAMAELTRALWGTEIPPTAAATVRTYLHRLRRVFAHHGGEPVITLETAGYALRVNRSSVDLEQFHRACALAGLARRENEPARAAEHLRTALSWYHGIPLAGLTASFVDNQRTRLEQAEALLAYEEVRRLLRDELGTAPSPRLRTLHERVLRSDPELTDAGPAPAPVKPAQLPADLPVFAGRADALASVAGDLAAGRRVVLARGPAGVGKSTFALRLAHRLLGRFPDGQLYTNLRGFTGAVDPQEVLRGFLHALDVPAHRIPTGLDARAAFFRSLVANRELLVVLDDAADSAQVLPLLPGGSGSVTLITSRHQLDDLVCRTGARTVALAPLPRRDAWDLLAVRLDAARLQAEPEAAHDIIDRCGRMPLALALACARISAGPPAFRLADAATELFGAAGPARIPVPA